MQIMSYNLENENEAYANVLCGHLRQMVNRLRHIPSDKWDFAPAPPAPTPRILATHAYQWLICDRMHINEADAALHDRVPDLPQEPGAACDALDAEITNWDEMLRELTPEAFAAPRSQFNQSPMNVRAFVAHMIQNCIYKNGQLATIYFMLGLDGTEPYAAPFPNPIYAEVFGERPGRA